MTFGLTRFRGLLQHRPLSGLVRSFTAKPLRMPVLSPALTRSLSSHVDIDRIRNIGISAHIDSGKTTLTERILFYSGRINAIHEVRGKDGVGAKMDSMDLEREKGITIQSAATFTQWKDAHINIIDTPGHVDFTIEVERALRVLDGAIMVLCGVAGVQSQSITVDRQMKRYNVPRIAFINKLDRMGANPWGPIKAIREELKLNAAPMQIPIGYEGEFDGVVDLVTMKAFMFEGDNGEVVTETEIPENLQELAAEKRHDMLAALADVDDDIAELFIMEEDPDIDMLRQSIRKATIALKFTPVFMGSAYKNRGVQPLLDAVLQYLPNPHDIDNVALDLKKDETPILVKSDPKAPLVALAFKLEDGRFGQLTYVRTYQGTLKKGAFITNTKTGKKVKVPRLVRMHSDDMEEIEEAPPGEIVAMFGVECDSGTTFTDGTVSYSMTSMHVPEAVLSLSIKPKDHNSQAGFTKALARFKREDPTFRVTFDNDTKETLISGMGELHLEIYVERMAREYNVQTIVGRPKVSYRETITQRADFQYTHKKQSGGSGQFGRVEGYLEPIEATEDNPNPKPWEFVNALIGNNIPPEFHPALEKGVQEAVERGVLVGCPVQGVRCVITDGAAHEVDSNEISFRLATRNGFQSAFKQANPQVLEPMMNVEVTVPIQFQGPAVSGLNRRRGIIQDTINHEDRCVVKATVPLNQMFGYSTELRSSTEGKGEFSMEYAHHNPLPRNEQDKLVKEYQDSGRGKEDETM